MYLTICGPLSEAGSLFNAVEEILENAQHSRQLGNFKDDLLLVWRLLMCDPPNPEYAYIAVRAFLRALKEARYHAQYRASQDRWT